MRKSTRKPVRFALPIYVSPRQLLLRCSTTYINVGIHTQVRGGIFLVIFFVAYMDVGKVREHDCMDAGGTILWKESVESSRERRPRTMPGAIIEDTEALLETKK